MKRFTPLGLALSLALAYPVANALPQGAQVVQGQVAVKPGLIQQASDKAIVNWQSFSIAAGETLRVQQPGVNSVLLNRVVGGDPSLILGQLQANGRAFLVNPRGIVFGRGSQVDVGGLVASTLDLSDTEFLAGVYRFSAGTQAGALQADGSIKATGGTVALVAPQLSASGSIEARRVGLAAASTVQVDVEGDGLVLFNLRNDDDRDVALKFSGRVLAGGGVGGGSAELRAQARAGAAGQVLNMDGLMQARGLRQQGGRIVIDGGTAGITSVNGSVDATGETGASITLLGNQLALMDGARVDASGRLGGGSLQVGGGFEGQGTAHNAERTWIGVGATLRADATEAGDGGRVAIWADGRTDMLGRISARGGAQGGNGGMVETSGRQRLNLLGSVDASAPQGRPGQWLLDPNDVVIKANTGSNVNVGAAPNFSTTDDAAIVDVSALSTALSGGTTVTVQTLSAGTNAQSGNIDVQAAIVPTGAATLKLLAEGNILFSSGSIGAGAGALQVELDAKGSITGSTLNTGTGNLKATAQGAINLGTVTAADLTINGGAGTVTLPGGSVSGDLKVTTSGAIAQGGALAVGGASTLSTAAATVTLAGFDSHGLSVTTTGGAVTLGTGTITGVLDVDSGGAQITQAAGGLTVTGTSVLKAGAGTITLAEANDLKDTVTLTGAATQVVSSKTAASVLKLGTSTLSGNLIATTGGGAITQTGTLTVSGTATLDAGSGDITLAGLSTGALTATSTAGNIVLGSGTVAALTATTSSNGAITQAAGSLNVTGSATVTGGAGGVVLGSFASAGLDVSATSGNLTLGTGTIGGPLTATTGAGNIGQSGALSVTGDATLSSLLGDITLASFSSTGLLSLSSGGGALTLGNGSVGTTLTASTGGAGGISQAAGSLTAGGLATLTAGAGGITLSSLDAHGLDATASNAGIRLGAGTITGALTADSGGGNITQAGAVSVTGNATLAAGAGSVTLGSFGSGGNVGITSTAGSITLGAGSITGTLTAGTAGTGAITQAGALSVGGLATLTAGSGGLTLGSFDSHGLTANATSAAIVLGAGTITGALSATTTGAGAISQAGALTVTGNASLSTGSGPITLGTANITGTLTAGTGGAGGITQTGSGVTAGGLATLSAGTGGVALTQLDSLGLSITAAGGGVTLGTGTITGNLGVTSGGTLIGQAAGGLTVTGTSTLNAGAGAITLSAANDLQDTVTLTGAATHIASKKTASSVLLLGGSTISSTLIATTAGGDITQTGTLTVSGTATLNAGAGAITLAGLSTGQLNLTSTAGNLTLGHGTVAGLSATTGGSGHISQAAGSLGMAGAATLTTASGAITLGGFSSGNFSATTSGGAVQLGTGTVTGTLGVTTGGGDITQAAGGLTVTTTSSLNAGAGDITLGQGNNLTGAITVTGRATQLTNSGAHALTLTSVNTSGALGLTTGGGDIAIGPGSVTGTLNASSSGGAISQTGTLSVSGLATLNAGAGSITLDGFGSAGLGATTAGGTLTLGTGTINGTLTATTAGGVVDQIAGGLIVTGNASVNAGGAAITLADAANDWRGTVTLTGGATQVTSTRNAAATLTLGALNTGNLSVSTAGGALNLGQGSVNGTLDATSAGGPISQTAALSVSGIATLDATTAGDITLANTSNQWHGLNLTGNALDLRSNGDLEILSLTQPANRALTLSAGANLILGPAANIDTGTADLKLASLGGVFTVGGVLKGHDVELQAHSGISLSKNLTATGNLKLTTASGGITQTTGIIAVTGTTAVDAGGSAIALAGASNDFGGAVSLTGSTTSVTDLNALTLGTLATGNLTVSSTGALGLGKGTVTGTLNANSHGGTITQATGAGSGLTLTGMTTLTAGNADITLTETDNDLAGAITATGGGVSLYSAHNLNLFALTQPANKALVLEALGTLTLPSGTTNIDTGSAALTLSSGGVFATFGTLKGGNVTLKGQSATLDHDITASGNLDLRTTTGTINQRNGRISVTGTSLFNAATFGITLNRPLNSFGGAVSLTGATADIRGQGNLTLATMAVSGLTAQAGNGLQLGTGTLSGSLAATAGGAITQAAGGLRVTGTSSFSGSGGITLLEATNAWTGAVSLGGGATQLLGSGAITLGGGNVSSLALTSGGIVSQSGALTVNGALTINAGGAAITLANGSNHLNGTITLTGGTTQLSTGGALSLGTLAVGALTLQASGNLNLGQGTVGGNLDASSGGGAVTQSGLLNVSGSASIQAGSGSITLTQGGNQWGGALSLGGGTAQVTSNGGLTLGTLGLASLQVDATGTLNLGQGSVSGTLTANSHGGNITQGGALDVGGPANLQAGGGAIALTQGSNHWGGAVQLTGGATQISGSGALTLGTLATGNLNATSTGALNLGQGLVAGNLVASSGGRVTQAGALQVNGSTTINAAGADITLANTGNRFIGAMSLSGNAVTLFNQPSLVLGTLAFNSLDATSNASITLGTGSLTGALTAKALGGTITQAAGGLSVAGVTTLQASSGITLTDAGNRLQGKVNLAGGTTALTNAGALGLGSVATGALTLRAGGPLDLGAGSIAGDLAATSSGAITQTGALAVSGTASLDAGSAAITLAQAGNALAGPVSLRGGNALITNGGALSLASLNVGDLTVQSNGALRLGTGTVAGALKAGSGGAAITQAAGGLAVGGASTLDAGSASLQLADAGNAFTGLVNLNAGNASLASRIALKLGSFTTRDLTLGAGGDLDLGTGSASGNLSASTRGSRISQTGALVVQGSSTFIADGGLVDLVLDQPGNQLLGPILMLGVNGGSFISANFSSALDLSFTGDVQTLTLASGGRLTLGGGHSTTLTAAARNGIVQTGALDVSGQTTLIARGGAAMPVALDHAGNDFRDVTLRSEAGGSFGRVQLRDGDASRRDGLRIGGDAAALAITSAGALDLGGGTYGSLLADAAVTGAAITQSGALAISGVATLKAGSGSVTLDRVDNRFTQIGVEAGLARLVSAGDYTVDASSVATRLDLGGPGAITLAGPLTGAGELLMSGSGSLTIASAQGHAGGTRIAAGRLVLQGPAAQAGSGAVQLGAAGELDLRDGATLGSELIAQGGSVLNTSGAGTLAGPVTLQATTSFLPGAGGLTVRGGISDGGAGFGLRLDSAGTLTLTGSNHYSGATDIAAGLLNANGTGALPATSAVQLAAGATLALGADQTVGSLAGAGRVALDRFTLATGADGSDTAFSGRLDGSGGLTKLGSGRFTLAGTGSHTGATRVEAGELVLASATALNDSTAVSVDAGALLTVQQNASLGSLAGAGTVDVQAALLAVGANGGSTRWDGSITGPGGLAKQGAGTFTLAGHNTLAGDLQVNAGTLALEGSGTVRPLALSTAGAATGPVVPTTIAVDVAGGATLDLLTDIALGALTGAGQVQLNASTLTLGASGRSGRFDGVVSGSGALTKAGTGMLTLGGANRYTGATVVDDGALVLDVAQALASASALAIHAPGRVLANAAQTVASLNGSGALVLNGASLASGGDGSDSRFDGVVSGSGSLVKQGAGTLTLMAANSHAGGTVIEAGTVQLSGQGSLGSGDIQNQGQLRLARSDALTLAQAIGGRGSLVVTQGQVTLASAGNSYAGATQVLGGSLVTTGAERLPDASAVQVSAGAQLQLGGSETIDSLQAAGSVRLAGNLTTRAEQVYTGSLTLANPAGITLAGMLIDASRSSNQFGGTPLGLSGGQALVTAKEALKLGDVSLSNGGRIEAERLALEGKLQLGGGSLALVATATPDDAKATLLGTAQVPVAGQPLAIAEATVQQGAGSAIALAEGASLQVTASGGGSVLLGQDANSFKGQLAVLSGAAYNTAWTPNAKGAQAVQSQVRVAGQQVQVGGSGIEADLVSIRADQLATAGSAALVARLPFDEIVLGRALSAPGMTLELAPGAFGLPGSFGSVNGQPIQVVVGSTETGARTAGPNAGYLTVLPKGGAQGATAVVLVGPKVGSVPASGGTGYRFFHDGASQATEIPVVYNGVLPLTPAASGAISSINGDAEDARRARFQETVRTENVTVRLRSGVIAEVGPGRASTQGSEGAKPPELCDPAEKPALSCKPSTSTP